MQIEKHKVVSFDYTLKDDDGAVLDSSDGHEPLVYLHGVGEIILGLETALEGRQSGDQFQITIEPDEGYGERDEGLCAEIERSHFDGFDDLEVGMQFQIPTDEGDDMIVTVVDIGDDLVTIDGNHELAGQTLNFDVAVRDVRDATEEEIDHGHAHGEGGHED